MSDMVDLLVSLAGNQKYMMENQGIIIYFSFDL